MACYVVGDIQGCYADFQDLLEKIAFSQEDTLWTVGDLVNRGPNSLEVLRFFKNLGKRAKVVLGNHDLHLLAIHYGGKKHLKPKDTLDAVLQAPDRDELLDWLRHRPLLHHDKKLGYAMLHAGLPPQWSFSRARQSAKEVENVLRKGAYRKYFSNHMYGDKPKIWSPDLEGWERIRFITNCFTRLRYCKPDGSLVLKKKFAPDSYNDADYPWFQHPRRKTKKVKIIFGHWSTLGYYDGDGVYALDTGCLWGGSMTALRLNDGEKFCLPCRGERKIKQKPV